MVAVYKLQFLCTSWQLLIRRLVDPYTVDILYLALVNGVIDGCLYSIRIRVEPEWQGVSGRETTDHVHCNTTVNHIHSHTPRQERI